MDRFIAILPLLFDDQSQPYYCTLGLGLSLQRKGLVGVVGCSRRGRFCCCSRICGALSRTSKTLKPGAVHEGGGECEIFQINTAVRGRMSRVDPCPQIDHPKYKSFQFENISLLKQSRKGCLQLYNCAFSRLHSRKNILKRAGTWSTVTSGQAKLGLLQKSAHTLV